MAAPPTPADVFSSKEQLFDRLVVVTNDAIYAANPDKEQVARAAALVTAAGAAVKTAMPGAEELPFAKISKIETNRHRTDLNIHHHNGTRETIKNIDFDNAATRDRAFESLRRRLGPKFRKDEVQYGLGRAMLAPIVTALAFAGVTWFLMGAAQELRDGVEARTSGRNALIKSLFVLVLNVLGPTGVVIVGVLFVAAALWWLVARIKNPPLMATLTAKK